MRNLVYVSSLICALLIGCDDSSKVATHPTPATAASPQPEAHDKALKPLPDRDPQLAKKLVAEGAVLLDVRTQKEWDEKHLDGAHLIPVDELDGRMSEIDELTGNDKSKPIVVFCKSGGRAGRAKDVLQGAGYSQVTNMGGIDDWPDD